MVKIARFVYDGDEILSKTSFDANGGILFDNGWLLIDTHSQDCCENVYANWDYIKDEAGLMDTDFSDLRIEEVARRRSVGIRLCGQWSFFVPCYNEQNGYYSDVLDIILFDTNQLVETEDSWMFGGTKRMAYKRLNEWHNVPVKDMYC